MIKEWLKRRREARKQRDFDRGYGWAMTRHHHHGDPSWFLEGCIYSDDCIWSDFDRGAMAAIRTMPEDEENRP